MKNQTRRMLGSRRAGVSEGTSQMKRKQEMSHMAEGRTQIKYALI